MRKLEKEAVKAEQITIMVMGMRGDTPQWVVKTDVTQPLYKALHGAGLPVVRVENMDRCFLMYMVTDADAAKMYRLIGAWPRTHWYKHKILKYLSKAPNELPLPI